MRNLFLVILVFSSLVSFGEYSFEEKIDLLYEATPDKSDEAIIIKRELRDIIETLQRLPLDLIGYEMDNRHRLDILFDQTPGQVVQEGWRPVNPIRTDNTFEIATDHKGKMGWHIDGKALPIDERAHVRLDRDGFAIYATEGSGYTESEGSIYLLPYYMARFHGLIK